MAQCTVYSVQYSTVYSVQCVSTTGPTGSNAKLQFVAISSLYTLLALICSSLGGAVYTAIGALRVYCQLAAGNVGVECC
jgi:hypothetical protein